MRAFCAFFLGMLALVGTAEARIGETAEESRKRYGEEQTLLQVRKLIDQNEVLLASAKKDFKNLPLRSDYSQKERDQFFDLAIKSAQYERFNKIKIFYESLKTKTAFERNALISGNKELEAFFGTRIVSYESLGGEIKNLQSRLERLRAQIKPPEKTYEGPDEMLRAVYRGGEIMRKEMVDVVEMADIIEKTEQQITSLKKRESEILEAEKSKSEDVLQFSREGYKIICYLKDDRTYQIFYSREEISNEDVMRILVNNSDDGVTWSSVVVKDKVVDDTEFLPLVTYHSSDGKLEGIFCKWIKDKDDLGDRRGVLIRERSARTAPAITKDDHGV